MKKESKKRRPAKKLFIAKVFREPLDFNEVCRLYCWGKNAVQVQERVEEVLKANHNLKALGFEPELLSVQTYEVEKENWEAISRFTTVYEF